MFLSYVRNHFHRTQCHITEDHHPQLHCYENLKTNLCDICYIQFFLTILKSLPHKYKVGRWCAYKPVTNSVTVTASATTPSAMADAAATGWHTLILLSLALRESCVVFNWTATSGPGWRASISCKLEHWNSNCCNWSSCFMAVSAWANRRFWRSLTFWISSYLVGSEPWIWTNRGLVS